MPDLGNGIHVVAIGFNTLEITDVYVFSFFLNLMFTNGGLFFTLRIHRVFCRQSCFSAIAIHLKRKLPYCLYIP